MLETDEGSGGLLVPLIAVVLIAAAAVSFLWLLQTPLAPAPPGPGPVAAAVLSVAPAREAEDYRTRRWPAEGEAPELLAGEYVALFAQPVVSLQLEADGSFRREAYTYGIDDPTNREGLELVDRGTWELSGERVLLSPGGDAPTEGYTLRPDAVVTAGDHAGIFGSLDRDDRPAGPRYFDALAWRALAARTRSGATEDEVGATNEDEAEEVPVHPVPSEAEQAD